MHFYQFLFHFIATLTRFASSAESHSLFNARVNSSNVFTFYYLTQSEILGHVPVLDFCLCIRSLTHVNAQPIIYQVSLVVSNSALNDSGYVKQNCKSVSAQSHYRPF